MRCHQGLYINYKTTYEKAQEKVGIVEAATADICILV